MTALKHYRIALESAWRAFRKQFRKRLTELRKGPAGPTHPKEQP